MTKFLPAAAVLAFALPVSAQTDPAKQPGSGFESKFAQVNGTRLH